MLRLTFIEGQRFVSDALANGSHEAAVGPGAVKGCHVRQIYVSESYTSSEAYPALRDSARPLGLVPIVLSDHLFASVADTESPQGIMAVITYFDAALPELLKRPKGANRILILDGVADPGNAGSMIRTAEAAAFSGVIMSEGCADLYLPKTLRATMGSALRVPIMRGAALPAVVDELAAAGVSLFASSPTARRNCFECEFPEGDLALVIGGEAFGVGPEVLKRCSGTLSIPMPGGAESLNAGVAAGILMYELVRRDLSYGGALRHSREAGPPPGVRIP
ncbi:MAG: RNA methyltransferase [Clostridiales bacterium]|jgi:TrmH family RNA methyltransferase|nr:RNA methyltransferase [Clostridiales bacterium]